RSLRRCSCARCCNPCKRPNRIFLWSCAAPSGCRPRPVRAIRVAITESSAAKVAHSLRACGQLAERVAYRFALAALDSITATFATTARSLHLFFCLVCPTSTILCQFVLGDCHVHRDAASHARGSPGT